MTSTATAEKTEDKKKPLSKTIAIVLDMSRQASNLSTRGLATRSGRGGVPVASSLRLTPTPVKDENGTYAIPGELKIQFFYGVNFGVSREAWDYWVQAMPPQLANYYNAGGVDIYEPLPGKEANSYADFAEEDATSLVLGTIAIDSLERYSASEKRENVLKLVTTQINEIKQDLEDRVNQRGAA